MLGFIGFLIVGLVAGALARLIVPGRESMGIAATLLLGVVGAFVGGTAWGLLSGDGFTLQAGGLVLSVVGAVIALLLYRRTARVYPGRDRPTGGPTGGPARGPIRGST